MSSSATSVCPVQTVSSSSRPSSVDCSSGMGSVLRISSARKRDRPSSRYPLTGLSSVTLVCSSYVVLALKASRPSRSTILNADVGKRRRLRGVIRVASTGHLLATGIEKRRRRQRRLLSRRHRLDPASNRVTESACRVRVERRGPLHQSLLTTCFRPRTKIEHGKLGESAPP